MFPEHCETHIISNQLIEKHVISKKQYVTNIVNLPEFPKKTLNITSNLDNMDAKFSGTNRKELCTLFVTEGKSSFYLIKNAIKSQHERLNFMGCMSLAGSLMSSKHDEPKIPNNVVMKALFDLLGLNILEKKRTIFDTEK